MKPKVAKTYLSGISLIALGFFFWVFLYQMFVASRATVRREQVLFDKPSVQAIENTPTKVNIFFQGSASDRISAATVSMHYPSELLEYRGTLGDTTVSTDPIEASCIANGYKLNQVLKTDNDPKTGKLTITRIALAKDSDLPNGLFCYGTITFHTKPHTSGKQGMITLSSSGNWEIVGLNGSYRPDVIGSNNHTTVTVE